MRLLLDTHVVLWCLDDDPRLSAEAWTSIETSESVWVSSASLWEAAIKYGLGRLSLAPERLAEGVRASGFLELPIRFEHAVALGRLPPLHRDPFDRILVAQAVSEPLHFMTADAELARYSPLVQLV